MASKKGGRFKMWGYFLLLFVVIAIVLIALGMWGILFSVMCDFVQERFWTLGTIIILIPIILGATAMLKHFIELLAENNIIL